ncbi:MAG: hypothetical protein Q8N53_10860 [Longimicrobiales bacterium]|nr:hypothetical protein [Longimicrobiales bacterium]
MSTVPHPRALAPFLLLVAPALLGGCGDGPLGVIEAPRSEAVTLASNAATAAGRAAFTTSCATCHASRDGFDLAFFGFADSTIVRRAVSHVDTSTALQIVQHIRALGVRPVGRSMRPFQVPTAASDVAFAQRLFGRDAWPEALTERALLALDPKRVAAAVAFPVWSDEATNLDWMPGEPLPPSVQGPPDGAAQKALRAYYAGRTDLRLVRAVGALRQAANNKATGPCAQSDDGALADPAVCFEATRWIAALGAQHALRTNLDLSEPVSGSTAVQDAFWDVGQAARRGLVKNKAPIPNAEANWVGWMYLGWVLAPGNHASGYTASGLGRVGLPRHATFVALRSLAARPAESHQPFADLATAAGQAPVGWLPAAYATGISVLEARAVRGWKPSGETGRAEAKAALERAAATLTRRLGARKAEPLLARTRALGAGL